MQDVVSSTALFEQDDQDSKIADVTYESESRSQTSAGGKRRSLSRQEAFRQTSRRPSRRTEYENDWQGSMKDVPNFDAFDTHLSIFAKENLPRPIVRDIGSTSQRRSSESLDAKEKDALSDAELVEYFAERMRQLPLLYGFKSSERFNVLQKAMSVNHDKNMKSRRNLFGRQNHSKNLSPTNSIKSESNSFKSKIKRDVLLPKINTTSDQHHYSSFITGPAIASPFRSNTERFPTKLGPSMPGPGMYDRVIGFPTQKQIGSYLSRGIYFTTNYS
ncbi:unnamed protein product [Adineta ricciae]|uniref:Uncharacterized protein n=1 Tax=Adineta ricciae TaxID=249248 RepID=A0A815UW61_ADIRI|nr:unnamed protein product [Adineta ricciae]